MKPLLASLLLSVLAIGLPALSQASGPTYHIEVIVFRAASPQGGPENWSAEAGAANTVGDESASGSAQVGHFVALLPAAQYQLTDIETRLRSSGALDRKSTRLN